MKGYVFRNESNLKTMDYMVENKIKVDCVLTSPPYNLGRGRYKNSENTDIWSTKYKYYYDNLDESEYINNMVEIFTKAEKVLKRRGVILVNLGYFTDGNKAKAEQMLRLILTLTEKINLSLADIIVWKKPTAVPNASSQNKCTRVCEFVYVLSRKNELEKFRANKPVVSVRPTGQKMYSSKGFNNFIEAKNNDGTNPYNKATFSTEFVRKLLQMYARDNSIVYDPFAGTGTTAIGCFLENRNIRCICSEIDPDQVKYSKKRLKEAAKNIEEEQSE